MGTAPVRRTTYSEYLALEAETGRKHEFDSGVVTMMGGGSPDHALLAMTFGRLLGNALAGGPCRPYSSDLKVWNADLDQAVYPDVTVICGPVVPAVHDRLAVVNPSLVAEVLSHSTRGRDALVKAPAYRAMPSVQDNPSTLQLNRLTSASGLSRQTRHQTSQGRCTSADRMVPPSINCMDRKPDTPMELMAA